MLQTPATLHRLPALQAAAMSRRLQVLQAAATLHRLPALQVAAMSRRLQALQTAATLQRLQSLRSTLAPQATLALRCPGSGGFYGQGATARWRRWVRATGPSEKCIFHAPRKKNGQKRPR